MKHGVPVSPGVAVARARRLDELGVCPDRSALDPSDLTGEIGRFDQACAAAAEELDGIIERVAREVGENEAAVFRSHRALLRDPALVAKVHARIRGKRLDAVSALQEALAEYTALFEQVPDEYLRERLADVRDVVGRIIGQLTLQGLPAGVEITEPVVLVAPEILPSQAVMFERLPVAGIVTETGGTTGHAAILARSLGIPAVSGLRGILREVHTHDLLVVDGREGHVLVNPGPEVEAAYRKLQREYFDLRDRLVENRDQQAVTADGVRVELLANVNGTADAVAAERVGAEGVGLFRTEYLFLRHAAVPDEDEQLAAYRAVIEAAPGRAVTIRTLDLGGDKHVPYLGTEHEANPFMGWRSIRLSTAYPEFFQTQLRAILRAGVHGPVSVLFPMISTVEEVYRLKQALARTKASLRRARLPFSERAPVGVMIEVPAAALCADLLLEEVDFVSIGSNDLIQYVMAADRDNPKVAHLCEPFAPAVFRLLHKVIAACVERDKPVTLCGEMAGRPRCVLPLIGMGLRRLSMAPAFVPTVKELVRSLTLPVARQVAEQVLALKTTAEVRDYLTRRVKQICPNVALFDTTQ
jgi:phosphoenolpyruvate-protein phosphotransferase (PTS system enzyme I)